MNVVWVVQFTNGEILGVYSTERLAERVAARMAPAAMKILRQDVHPDKNYTAQDLGCEIHDLHPRKGCSMCGDHVREEGEEHGRYCRCRECYIDWH